MAASPTVPDRGRTQVFPVLSLLSTVVFPHDVAVVQVGLEENVSLLKRNRKPDALVVLAFANPPAADHIRKETLSRVAVIARIIDRLKLPGRTYRITVQGLRRAEVHEIIEERPYFRARVEESREHISDPFKINVLVQKAINLFERLVGSSAEYQKESVQLLKMNVENPSRFADLVCVALNLEYADRHKALQAVSIEVRLRRVIEMIRGELDRAKVAQDVEKRARGDIEESRREYFLRQQIKTIQKELGDEELNQKEADVYAAKLSGLSLADEVSHEALREIERLRHIQPSSSEYHVIKTFLDRFFALPWGLTTEEQIELPRVRETLDAGHYGLKTVKERILEFLAVRKLNPNHKGPIICFVGPPGVGKTSLGRAIAEAIGRSFFRISFGGVRDEAEIRGHRRTYVGALPGKILAALSRVGTTNPLLMLDEIDKLGADYRGDPADALLEVLDPEQNHTFTDHYFNVPFDLSKVLFIVTANYLHDIPKPLLDRLEVIALEGYTENEKLEIGRRHLVPKVIGEHGLDPQPPEFTNGALRTIIRYWTREAGVRNLQRSLEKLCRKIARRQVEEGEAPVGRIVESETLEDDLGPRQYLDEEGLERDEVGAATGLAWTATGGEILVIEALSMTGQGKLIITGKLGEVMKESVQAAFSFARSRAPATNIDCDALDKTDIHIHFPAAAVPKDGPSAGVTVTIALASLLSGLPVRRDMAMTGEVTLRGKVLPVGGVKDKVLAAYRAGLRQIVLPKGNEKDLVEVPEEVREAATFYLIDHMDRLFELALVGYRPPADLSIPDPSADTVDVSELSPAP